MGFETRKQSMEHGLQISLKRYALSMEDKMSRAFGHATNCGWDGQPLLHVSMSAFSKTRVPFYLVCVPHSVLNMQWVLGESARQLIHTPAEALTDQMDSFKILGQALGLKEGSEVESCQKLQDRRGEMLHIQKDGNKSLLRINFCWAFQIRKIKHW